MIKENNIFIIGIKGAAMANLAVILKKMGKNVTGSDTDEEFITSDILIKHSISYINNFEEKNLPSDTHLVIYSAAHKGINNPQAKAAINRGITVKHQVEVLSDIVADYKNSVAVCGCHGKTTTSSLLAYALLKLGLSPSYLVGSSEFEGYSGGDYLGKEYFVFEADEYGINPPLDKTPKLLFLKPNNIICTNIDFDHPDVYQNIDETKKTFSKFFTQSVVKNSKAKIFVCADDSNSLEAVKGIDKSNYFTYGFSQGADYHIFDFQTDDNGSIFKLTDSANRTEVFRIGLFGEKNVTNAAAVIALLINMGLASNEIRSAIESFHGAKRRFEEVAFINDVYLFDDYGHHPKEIETTINAARKRFPDRRILVIFQPHTYSRTQSLLGGFAKSLSLADESLLLPIFPSARENIEKFRINSHDIVTKAANKRVYDFPSSNLMMDKLKKLIRPRDVVFTMGAGDVYKLKDDIIELISKLKSQNPKK